MSNCLGSTLRDVRKKQHLTQKRVAEGICSQSMLSAIEHDRYTPNADLLIRLCNRLGVKLSEISLANNYNISENINFNQKISGYCNQHQYDQLKRYLLSSNTIDQVESEEQTQAYYYYLGVALYNTHAKLNEVERNFRLAASCHGNVALTRLSLVSMALVKTVQGKHREVNDLLSQATANLEQLPYEENLNIIDYLAAMSYYRAGKLLQSYDWLIKGIDFTATHNSHYMLANYYRLLTEVAKDSQERDTARQRSDTFKKLFKEKTFTQFEY